MRLLLSTNTLGLGGSESYLVTLGEALDRLGHRVTLHAHVLGAMAEPARGRGLEVVEDTGLPAEIDAAIVQDAAVSFDLARRYPRAPQLFVAHSTIFDLQSPPQLAGLVAAAVALNERVAARLRALAADLPVVRLRQPIDVQRFVAGRPLRNPPWRALAVSNRLTRHREPLRRACDGAGIELIEVGSGGTPSLDPRNELMDADIVFGYGRSVLEAMACGRAVYVYDERGGDGWVTPETYPALEANGFAGGAGVGPVATAGLAAALRNYDPELGLVARDLVTTHHRADQHAGAIAELLAGFGMPARPAAPLDEMARLARLQWRAHSDAWAAEQRRAAVAEENERLLEENQKLRSHLSGRRGRIPPAALRRLDELRGRDPDGG
jgi:hypothetical protein